VNTSTVTELRSLARAHNWRHFATIDDDPANAPDIMVKGEGCYLIDAQGNRYFDALSNLYCVNIGYSHGAEIGAAALAQYEQLPYCSNWGSATPPVVQLAVKLADLAPGDLNHVFFTPSGGESVEAAWKLARQYHALRGQRRWKAIARNDAYHGTTLGALSLNGNTRLRNLFEPLVPTVAHVRSTRRVERPAGETDAEFAAFLLDDIEHTIVAEGPSTVAMIIVEPVQNSGGNLTAPDGYFAGLRALCDKYGILLVADETITAFGRLGAWFGSHRYGIRPDIVTTAKGLSSAYGAIGAVIVSDCVFETFAAAPRMFVHGNTFGGHPVMAAVALKNLEIMERLDLPGHVLAKETELGGVLGELATNPMVRDVRGTGYFYAIELATSRPDGTQLTGAECGDLYGDARLADRLKQLGVLLRVYAASSPTIGPILSIAPPLVADTAEFTLLAESLTTVLGEIAEAAGL
jgi:adenosylmethionine-8-amino-7-oxononanoate aminotransferase